LTGSDTARVIVNANNQKVWLWDSAPFGDTAANEQPTGGLPNFTFNLRFPGQQYDRETGTHYNYFRDYEAGSGRYVQSDPIGLGGDGPNTYAYVLAAPVSMADEYGLGISIGDVMTYRDYKKKRRRGGCKPSLRGHHVPSSRTLAANGISKDDGVIVVLDHTSHTQTQSFGGRGKNGGCDLCAELDKDLADPPVASLGADVCDAIRCLNRELHPDIFE